MESEATGDHLWEEHTRVVVIAGMDDGFDSWDGMAIVMAGVEWLRRSVGVFVVFVGGCRGVGGGWMGICGGGDAEVVVRSG